MNTARLLLKLEHPAEAAAAIAPDDPGSLVLNPTQNGLEITAKAETPMGLLRTLDDVLGCLRATMP